MFQLEKACLHRIGHSHLKISWLDFFSRKEFLILGYLLNNNQHNKYMNKYVNNHVKSTELEL